MPRGSSSEVNSPARPVLRGHHELHRGRPCPSPAPPPCRSRAPRTRPRRSSCRPATSVLSAPLFSSRRSFSGSTIVGDVRQQRRPRYLTHDRRLSPNVWFQTIAPGRCRSKSSRVLPGRARPRIVRSQTMQEDAVADQHQAPDEVLASLRNQGIDVVRVSYSDMIGVDRGRDVLLQRAADGPRARPPVQPLRFTTPRHGRHDTDPGRHRRRPARRHRQAGPEHAGAAALGARAMACLGDVAPRRHAAPESPRTVVGRVAEHLAQLNLQAVVGPELEYFICEPSDSAAAAPGTPTARATSMWWAARLTPTACCCGPCATCARPGSRSPRPTMSTAPASSRSTSTTASWSTPPTARSG